jgi:hypothetical protein
MKMEFSIEEDEVENVRKWIDIHPCKIRGKYGGAIGGGTTFCFTNTTIGQIQTVKCACGEKYVVDTKL